MTSTFDTLTTEQKAALTNEEVEHHIKLACAETGVPMLPPDPGPAPTRNCGASKDVTYYVVGNINFVNIEDAQACATYINKFARLQLDYAPGGSYLERIANPEDDDTLVATGAAWSSAGWAAVRAIYSTYDTRKAEWDKAKTEYEAAAEKASAVHEDIWAAVNAARNNVAYTARMRAEVEEYIKLAGGNREIAARFFLNARPSGAVYLPEDMRPSEGENHETPLEDN